jgi:serine/threonine-protein kinase SBK
MMTLIDDDLWNFYFNEVNFADFSKIKLCDFGSTQRQGVLVCRNSHTWSSFIPPEVLEIVRNEKYCVKPSSDVWQFGIILFLCLTGSSPW